MSLSFAGSLDRSLVIAATDRVAELVARPEIATRWTDESSCDGMSIGGLTRHLISQPVNVVKLVRANPPQSAESISLLEHYARAAWLREDLDGTFNTSIRESSDAQATEGYDVAVEMLTVARGELSGVLADAPSETYIPWQDWSLQTDDFLVTRLMEMVVHSDDLAASVEVEAPEFDAALDPVFRLLTALSVRRHGQDALVRALTRPQRAPSSVSAF